MISTRQLQFLIYLIYQILQEDRFFFSVAFLESDSYFKVFLVQVSEFEVDTTP